MVKNLDVFSTGCYAFMTFERNWGGFLSYRRVLNGLLQFFSGIDHWNSAYSRRTQLISRDVVEIDMYSDCVEDKATTDCRTLQ